ncbi:hypothetical protein [Burkholderia cepacia]|uniref:Uncharacterized protein n=1 Tax=Burkholderia cepacia TaxID=292 RepID=A0AAX2RK73_BURCE|nr:hypothetical protein [Burkholderia cepacia]TES99592.1 hypothetical protein E3D36_24180 [Burkholderia cepacia]TEU41585.1 hypothetical protein E3D37_26565 [Burkholderia cepacia]TEU48788.1 hypothetical protein E3D38_21570 [Burkholderia cepacia]TEU95326.1 hypothetical protein E3D40_24655 [Burkholderia cepacia]TEV04720.1 hypothetical protein E3D44_26180 [Burkholderia cepacia]
MSFTAFKVKNIPPPGKKRVGDWLNMRVRTKCEMANGYATIPAGALATVTGTGNGLWLKIDPCPHCGISVNITRVHGSDVEPIDVAQSGAVA